MKTSLITKLSVLGAVSLFAACGVKLGSVGPEQASTASNSENTNRDKVTIPVSIQDQQSGTNLVDQAGLGLAGVNQFNISISGCASGFSDTLTDANFTASAVELYDQDTGCVAALNSFQVNGITYSAPASPVWDEGSHMTYSGSGSTLEVTVASQLAGTISAGQQITFTFSELIKGSEQDIVRGDVVAEGSIAISGEEAPDFTVSKTIYNKISTGGYPKFQFKLECGSDVVYSSAGNHSATTCNAQTMASLKYMLFQDPDTNGAANLTQAQLDGMAGWSSAEVVDNSHELIVDKAGGSPTDADLAHGGFFINTDMISPAKVHANPYLILAVQSTQGSVKTYTWFRVKIYQVNNH